MIITFAALKLPLKFLALVFSLIVADLSAHSACTTPISAFPYAEDFELGAGGWTTGGLNNDWTLGAPSKPIISAAASGNSCWIAGGLAVSFYQYGERSWVESPCFDFSLLDFPIVSFQIFWETENQYDGGNFQYSIDGGTTWTNVGTNNEAADCFTQNWFNQSAITNLNSLVNVSKGWGGTSLPTAGNCLGGGGSGTWKLAKHCLKNLAHEPEVIFRFTFGSGTQCNDYDGIAFDDFRLEEAPQSIPSFTFSCTSSASASFTDASTGCPATFSWNFGDGNTSSVQNPSHTFSGTGIFDVMLVTGNACSAADTFLQSVTISDAIITGTDETCAGMNDGSASVSVNPPGNYSYSWNTVPVQSTPAATGLSAGTYTVTVSGNNSCGASGTVQLLTSTTTFSAIPSAIATSCDGVNDGRAILYAVNPSLYSYAWNTVPVQTADTAYGLAPGSYTVTINGPGICVPLSFTVDVPMGTTGTPAGFLGSDTSTCTGTAIVLQAGSFSLYAWDDGSDSSFRYVETPGYYFVEVTTPSGCVGSDSIYVEEKCLDDVVFPNSFTPNEDGKNDTFFAYGTGVKAFNMKIFDRWGEKIFESTAIDSGWDGTYVFHRVNDGIYACVVSYSMDGVNTRTKKGMVALIR
jgi:gliding motility-associated-like protein